uniref:F-box associated beta-propeller type 3 domain-containing protein n=1 Tax=Aegilops tauschii TaxID=37682 RepID=M8B269_AEGTA
MAEAPAAAATTLLPGLPDEILVWEILVRLDPKSILRSRAVRRDWRCATTNHRFLQAHHARQPALPILSSDGYRNILTFDHRAAAASQLHTVARLALSQPFKLEASCDGLLILSKHEMAGSRPGLGPRALLTVCNPVTRQHASLTRTLKDFNILGMYPHRPTGKYRLLLQGTSFMDSSSDRTGWYVLELGSYEAPRYIGCSKAKLQSAIFHAPVWVRDSLHWYPVCYTPVDGETAFFQLESKLVIVFDTIAESFRQIRAPLAPRTNYSCIFEMDNMLGIYSCDKAQKIVDIWVLHNYESEVWELKYRVDLTIAEIWGKFEGLNGDGDVLLLVRFGQSENWLFYVDTDGKLVASFQDLYVGEVGNKKRQILLLPDLQVAPDFWKTLEHYW